MLNIALTCRGTVAVEFYRHLRPLVQKRVSMQSATFLGCQPFMIRVSEACEPALRDLLVLKCLLADCSASFEWSKRDRIDFADKNVLDCSVFAGFEKDVTATASNNNSTHSPCLLFLFERSFYLIDHTVIGQILLPKLSSHIESGSNAAVTFVFSNDLAVKLHQKQGNSLEKLAKFVYYVNNALTSDVHVYESFRAVATNDEDQRLRYIDAATARQEVATRVDSLLAFLEKAQALTAPAATADGIADSLMRCSDGEPLHPQSALWCSGHSLGELAELARDSFCDESSLKAAGRALAAQGEQGEQRVRRLVEEVCRGGGKRKHGEADEGAAPLAHLRHELRVLARVAEDMAVVRSLPRSDIL